MFPYLFAILFTIAGLFVLVLLLIAWRDASFFRYPRRSHWRSAYWHETDGPFVDWRLRDWVFVSSLSGGIATLGAFIALALYGMIEAVTPTAEPLQRNYTVTPAGFHLWGTTSVFILSAMVTLFLFVRMRAGSRKRSLQSVEQSATLHIPKGNESEVSVADADRVDLKMLTWFARFRASYEKANAWAKGWNERLFLASLVITLGFGTFSGLDVFRFFSDSMAVVAENPHPIAAPTESRTAAHFNLMMPSDADCMDRSVQPVGPRLIGHFSVPTDGTAIDQLDDGDIGTKVAAMLASLRRQYSVAHHVRGFILIGSADRRRLSAALVARFHDNEGIATARAQSVHARINDLWEGDSQPGVYVAIRRPELASATPSDKVLAPDRTVAVCVLWG